VACLRTWAICWGICWCRAAFRSVAGRDFFLWTLPAALALGTIRTPSVRPARPAEQIAVLVLAETPVDKARKKPDASAYRGVSHARRHVVPVGLGAQFAPSTVGARSAASCLQAGHPYRPFGRAMGHHHRNRPIPSVGPACPDQARAPIKTGALNRSATHPCIATRSMPCIVPYTKRFGHGRRIGTRLAPRRLRTGITAGPGLQRGVGASRHMSRERARNSSWARPLFLLSA
jgi:hypothetical protein